MDRELERHFENELRQLEAEHALHEARLRQFSAVSLEGREYQRTLRQAHKTLQELTARLDNGWQPADLEYHVLFFASLLDDFEIQRISDGMDPNLPPKLDVALFRYIIGKLAERVEQHFKPVN